MEWGGVNVGRGIYYSNKGKKRESRLKIRWKLFKKSNQTCLRCRNECSSWNHELVVYSSPVLTNHAQTRPFRISRGSDHSRRKSFRFWRGWTILEHLVLESKLTCAPPSSVHLCAILCWKVSFPVCHLVSESKLTCARPRVGNWAYLYVTSCW